MNLELLNSEKSRARFESWITAAPPGRDVSRDGPAYVDPAVEAAWRAYVSVPRLTHPLKRRRGSRPPKPKKRWLLRSIRWLFRR